MNNRRITLGLGTGAGALLGAALLSGLTSPIAAADPATDTYAFDPVTGAPATETLPAFGGLGTDTITYTDLANYDVTPATPDVATGDYAGTEDLVTNTYSNPFFTDTSTDVVGATGLADTANTLGSTAGTTTDTLYFDPSLLGNDFGITLTSVPGVGTDAAPTVTEDLITPLGQFPISDLLGGSDLSSLLGGGDLTSLLGGGDLSSLLGGGDLLAGLDPLSLLGSI